MVATCLLFWLPDSPSESTNKAVFQKLVLALEDVKREWNYIFGEFDPNDKSNPYGEPSGLRGEANHQLKKILKKKMIKCVDLLVQFEPIEEARACDKQTLEVLKQGVSKLDEELLGKNDWAHTLRNLGKVSSPPLS